MVSDPEGLTPLKRPIPADRHPVAVAPVGVVVPERTMLGAAVVPERHRARLPAEAHLELRRLDMAEQRLQEAVALVLGEADDAHREETVDEQHLLARDGMRAHHRVLGARIDLAAVVVAVAAAVELLA